VGINAWARCQGTLADPRLGQESRGRSSRQSWYAHECVIADQAPFACRSCDRGLRRSRVAERYDSPRGSLTLTGAVGEHVAQRTPDAQSWCHASMFTPPPPALSPLMTTLEGVVHFGSASGAVSLHFVGGPGLWELPLPGETTYPGPPGSVVVTVNGRQWSGGQSSPASSGSLILSDGSARSIRGSLNATLAPSSTDAAGLKVVGTWTC
jgi:hypothetical protein